MNLEKDNIKTYKIHWASDLCASILFVVVLCFIVFGNTFLQVFLLPSQASSIPIILYFLFLFGAIMYAIKIPYLIISHNKILLKNIWSKNIEIYIEDIHSIEISKYKVLLNIRNKKPISIIFARFSHKDRYEIYKDFQRISKERCINLP
ncbi:hypothetical protein KAU33_05675 [Candidatus Dependentiae bacterium]|nr:hypothetical protein [Candidatus Dependentiae bacterium]